MTQMSEHTLKCPRSDCQGDIVPTGEAASQMMYKDCWTIRIPARCVEGDELLIVIDNTWSQWPTVVNVLEKEGNPS